jgi:hypothetical protein
VAVGHPFDTVKVRLQTQSKLFTSGLQCVSKTVTTEGVLALFKGMGSPMASVPLQNAVSFAAYGQAKLILSQNENRPLSLWEISAAGAFSGGVTSVVATPVELIRNSLQTQHERFGFFTKEEAKFRGPLDCMRQIISLSGFRGLFRGILKQQTLFHSQVAPYSLTLP